MGGNVGWEIMPKIAAELSSAKVASLRAAGRHAVGGVRGLHLRITDAGARSWVLRAVIDGRRTDLKLGDYPAMPLAEARRVGAQHRNEIITGGNPAAERKAATAERKQEAAAAAMSFERAARTLHATLAPGWKNAKHSAQWISTLTTYAFPSIGGKPVGEVTVSDVVAIVKPIWLAKPETASRVLQRMGSVFNWAAWHGHAGGNPAAVVAKAPGLLPKQRSGVNHHKALPYHDVPALMAALDGKAGAAAALRFLILTAARSGEVRLATWGEVDLDAALWTVPAERMKAGREHRVPLSAQALDLLRASPRFGDAGDLIFPSTQLRKRGGHRRVRADMSDMTLAAVLKRLDIDVTVHGMRSSFRDWCSEQGVAHDVAERALAHTVANKTEAAYNRTDLLARRRSVMQAWADHCAII